MTQKQRKRLFAITVIVIVALIWITAKANTIQVVKGQSIRATFFWLPNAPSDSVTVYNLYRDGIKIADTPDTSMEIAGITATSSYYLRAKNRVGESMMSDVVKIEFIDTTQSNTITVDQMQEMTGEQGVVTYKDGIGWRYFMPENKDVPLSVGLRPGMYEVSLQAESKNPQGGSIEINQRLINLKNYPDTKRTTIEIFEGEGLLIHTNTPVNFYTPVFTFKRIPKPLPTPGKPDGFNAKIEVEAE